MTQADYELETAARRTAIATLKELAAASDLSPDVRIAAAQLLLGHAAGGERS